MMTHNNSPAAPTLRLVRIVSALAVCLASWLQAAPAAAEGRTNSVGMTLRLIEAGRYERGENDLSPGFYKDHTEFTVEDARPVHPVVLTRPFYLGTTEVTVEQFRQFVDATGYVTTAEKNPAGGVGWDPMPPKDIPSHLGTFRDGGGFSWRKTGFEQGDKHPVTGVSFEDARAFCDWLSKKEGLTYRLPTEAEWEYAARAGTDTYFSFGNEYRGRIQRFANIGNVELERTFPDRVRRQWLVDIERDPADRHVFTAPVGSYDANPWGLFDLYGNVWEWCEDRYLDTAYTPYTREGYQQLRERAIDPVNTEKGSEAGDWRVIRGGSWFNAPIQCRSSVRGFFEASDAACYLGFRVACDAAPGAVTQSQRRFERSEAARATVQRLADRVQERRDGRLTIELNQQRQKLTEEFLKALQELDEPVDIYLDGRGELTADQLAGLLKTQDLRGLLLSGIGPRLKDADFARLERHPRLELLHLTGAPGLSDELFSYLRQADQLELLQLESAAITDDGLQQLPQLQRLKTLVLHGTASRGLALARFRGSPLDRLACNHLSDEAAELLPAFPVLRDLSVTGSPLTGRGLQAIARLPRLQRLDLTGCKELQDADFTALDQLLMLDAVQLQQTAAGDQTVAHLSQLNNLREVRIGSEQLTDAGVKKLCELVGLRNLAITADAVHLTDAAFADLWRLVNLNSLSIAAPRVTGTGLGALAELPRLEWLYFEGKGTADPALLHAAQSDSLRSLTIGSWQNGGPAAISDAGLMHLAGARSLDHITLMRRGSQVSDDGLATFRKSKPQLTLNVH